MLINALAYGGLLMRVDYFICGPVCNKAEILATMCAHSTGGNRELPGVMVLSVMVAVMVVFFMQNWILGKYGSLQNAILQPSQSMSYLGLNRCTFHTMTHSPECQRHMAQSVI